MSQREVNPSLRTEICNPVPAKNAFNADYNVFFKSIGHKLQIISGTFHVFVEYSFTAVVDDTDVHALIKKPKKCNAFFRLSTKLLATFMERFLHEGRFQCKIDAGSYRISLRFPPVKVGYCALMGLSILAR